MRLLPVKLFFIKKTKKFKKVVQNMSKRWSKTMPVRTPNPVFRESFFKFWNSHTNQVLKTPISSGRVTQLISAPWKVITSRRRERGRERGGGARISILSAPTTGLAQKIIKIRSSKEFSENTSDALITIHRWSRFSDYLDSIVFFWLPHPASQGCNAIIQKQKTKSSFPNAIFQKQFSKSSQTKSN